MKSIRRANLKDVDRIYEIEEELFDQPWSKESIIQLLQSPIGFMILYEEEVIEGYVGWMEIFDEIHLLNVGVTSSHQGQGIARLLLEILTAYGDDNGRVMTLEVHESNEKAQKLYESFQFQVEGRRKNYYGQGQDALIMWRR